MREEVERLYQILQEDFFTEEWLSEVSLLKNESIIIYDDSGSLINGNWYGDVYPKQKPGIRTFHNQNYAVYDTRYNPNASIGKKYSEIVHELFHCLQLRNNVGYKKRMMIEGAALFVECVVYSRYVNQSVGELIDQYGKNMLDDSFDDYYRGAKYIYEKMCSGLSWKDYFSMKM